MRVRLSPVLSAFIVLVVFGGGIAGAETINCTAVTTVPTTISSPGIYCLTGDVDGTSVTTGHAIDIDADNVILDLKGHTLIGPPTALLNTGIFVEDRRNVTIMNGTVLGFDQQVREGGRGNIIEDLRLDGGFEYPIVAAGQGTLIRRNLVVNCRISGIGVGGSNTHVIDNDVVDCGSFFGIQVGGDHHFVVNNRVSGAPACGIDATVGTGNKIRDNIVTGAITPYCGGADVGNND